MSRTTEPTPKPLSAEELARQREVAAVHRADELARLTAAAEHDRALADVAQAARLAELDRAEQQATAEADAALTRMYRQARAAGERTRIAATMARSGEARALRLERLRAANLWVLVPVLLGFATWSTTGVQQGAAWLMHAPEHSATWWALWALEPVLVGAVVWVIVVRARLASSGGRLDEQARNIAVGCLSTSILLNLAAAASTAHWHRSQIPVIIGAMLAHAIGPVGAAATAHLIGVIDDSIAAADPWKDAPQLAELAPQVRSDVRSDVRPDIGGGPAADMSAGTSAGADISPARARLRMAGPRHRADLPQVNGSGHHAPSADIDTAMSAIPDLRSTAVPQSRNSWTTPPETDVRGHVRPDVRSQVRADIDSGHRVAMSGPAVPELSSPAIPGLRTGRAFSEEVPQWPDGGGDDGQAELDDEQRRTTVIALLRDNPDVAGAEIARVLNVSDRHGRRLKNEALALLDDDQTAAGSSAVPESRNND